MNKLTFETFNNQLPFSLLKEQVSNNLIVVDVQPEYEQYIPFPIYNLTNWINSQKFENITFLYNGADTLGMTSEQELHYWYAEHGLDETILENSNWYDKGYAFFRYCMDSGMEDNAIVKLVQFMKSNNINDSRDMDENAWNEFMKIHPNEEDIRYLMEHADDMIHIPDVMEYLEKLGNNFTLIGGGTNECLKEVEIALQANNQSFKRIAEWVY